MQLLAHNKPVILLISIIYCTGIENLARPMANIHIHPGPFRPQTMLCAALCMCFTNPLNLMQ